MNFWMHTKGLLFATVACLTLSCGPKIKRPIEDRVSGPFSLLSIPGRTEVLVINSSTSGEYEDGSISLYTAETNGKLSLKSSVSTKRLGVSGAVSADGKMLAVSFAGEDARLRFFQIDSDNLTEKSNLSIETRSGEVFDQIHFFTPTSGDPSHYYLYGYSNGGKVIVYRAESDKSTRLFTLPDDMPGPKPDLEGYSIAVGAPVYVEKDDLFVTFPLDTLDTSSRRPRVVDQNDEKKGLLSTYKIGAGEWDPVANKSGDIRALSALAIDFEKYLADGNVLRNAAGYFPFIHTDKYLVPVKGVPEPADDLARYRFSFQNSTYVNSAGCLTRNPSATFAEDSVLISQNATDGSAVGNRGTILQLNGWSAIKTKIGALEAAASDADYEYRKKVFFQMPELKLYSRANEVLVGASRTTPIQVLEQNSSCQPVWARIEIADSRALSGMEKSTLITQVGDSTQKPIESSNSLMSRGLGNVTVSGSQIFAASYSFDVLQTFKFENNVFSKVP